MNSEEQNNSTLSETTAASGTRAVAIGGDVSDSQIYTGDIINIAAPAISVTTSLHQLRPPVGDFVGREHEIESLIHALRRNSRAGVTGISGMGGIGKTELALLVAQRLSPEYPDAQFFINLQGTDANPRPPAEVMGTCIRAFRGQEAKVPEDPDELSQLYLSELSGKRVLLLLDNAADSNQVLALLPPAGSVALVTSRRAIAVPGMTPLTLGPLTHQEALDLLIEIAPHAKPVAEQICALCGYLPLAIRAAGGLLRTTADLDPVVYAAQLTDERGRLERIGAEGVAIGVAASFNLSYVRLSADAARVFRVLSVFPAGFDAAAEEAVCEDAQHKELSDLVRRSLVLYDAAGKRYRLHDLARLFARSKLSEEEQFAGQRRHATHYVKVLKAANDLYLEGGDAMLRGLAVFDLEWGNILEGHAWIEGQGEAVSPYVAQLGMSYPIAGGHLLDLRQHSDDRILWLKLALAAAVQLQNRAFEAAAAGFLGIAYGQLRQTDRAIEFNERYLKIAREIGDRRGEGTALGNLGNAYASLSQTERAINAYKQYLVIAGEVGDRRGEGTALGNLGTAYAQLDDKTQAFDYYKQFLAIARETGDQRAEATALWNMSLAFYELGQLDEAIDYAEQSLTIRQRIDDPNIAKVRHKLEDWRKRSKTY